jgi:hypothetical protein
LQTISPGWLPTEILLISALWVTTIIGMSQWCPTAVLPWSDECEWQLSANVAVWLPSKVNWKWLGIICSLRSYILFYSCHWYILKKMLTIFSSMFYLVFFPWVRWELFLPTLPFSCWEFP